MKRTILGLGLLAAAACSDDTGSTVDSSTIDAASGVDASSGVDCSTATTTLDKAVCQAAGFLDTLSASQLTTANPAFTDTASRTRWSNLPTGMVARGGIQFGTLSATSQAAALELMSTVLGDSGAVDRAGVQAADAYLAANGGGSGYGAGLYYIGVFGTPSATGDWALMFGGHHMAYNLTFHGGEVSTTPNHLAVEPKASFTQDGTTYQPMADEGAAMVAMYTALSATQLSSAHLTGTYSDVLIGPVEYGTGSSASVTSRYPSGANRTGVLVSSLSAAQQALVTAAIEAWAADFDSELSADPVAAYTSSAAYQDTYIAWAGSSSSPDVDVSGTYMRIDGPRVWIELACQNGVVISGMTHYHSIFRDKSNDYAGTL